MPIPPDPRAARLAIRLVFLVNGAVLAGWAPLVPLAKARLGLDEGQLGLVLLALGAGAILAMPLAGMLIARHGSRAVSIAAGLAFAALLPLLALAPDSPAAGAPLLALALFAFGAANGLMDVAMNAQAVAVEAKGTRPIMSSIHGIFSIGGLLGAVSVSLMLRAGLSPVAAALALGAAAMALLAAQARALLPRAEDRPGDGHGFALPRGPVLAFGLLCFIMLLAEGSMIDWSAVYLVQQRGMEVALAGLGFGAFSVAMAAARLSGDALNARLGPVRLLRGGALLAALGLAVVVVVPQAWGALLGFVLVGLGIGNAVPLLFSAAGRLPGVAPGTAIAAVATLGYAGLLAGPALIGFAARLTSLPVALAGVALLVLAVAAWAGIARNEAGR
ncbi:MFS transporter [Teichococcus aestuarii]|uniref:MFS transporter n=1 Tax=Teichococcus aestuarii TaxID=568898 RepID=UPI00360CE0D6